MTTKPIDYNNFAGDIEDNFPYFKESKYYKFAPEYRDLQYVYAAQFAQYITELMLSDPKNSEINRLFELINNSYRTPEGDLENLIKLQFFDYWRVSAENKSDYIASELTGAARSNFINILNYYKNFGGEKGS